jgi:hypothetical protein
MLQRCTNPKASGFVHYGGRGITVCERWRADFRNFLEDMGEKPPGLSIDRIELRAGQLPMGYPVRAEQEPAAPKHDHPWKAPDQGGAGGERHSQRRGRPLDLSRPCPRQHRREGGASQAAYDTGGVLGPVRSPLSTLKDWEQHRRTPEGPSRVLLTIIDRAPEAVERALAAA